MMHPNCKSCTSEVYFCHRIQLATRWLVVCLCISNFCGQPVAAAQSELGSFSRPRAMAMVHATGALYIANEQGGIAVLDIKTNQLDSNKVFQPGLLLPIIDIAVTPDGKHVLTLKATRNGESFLAINRISGGALLDEIKTGMGPGTIAISQTGKFCTVTSRWARCVHVINIKAEKKVNPNTNQGRDPNAKAQVARPILSRAATINLPFAPHMQWVSPDHATLIVADAFAGRVAFVDLLTRRLRSVRTIDATNIRGLAATSDGERLVFAHNLLMPYNPTTKSLVFYGFVVSSTVRSVAKSDLLAPSNQDRQVKEQRGPLNRQSAARSETISQAIARWRLTPLGEPEHGAGDPGQIVITTDGTQVVCISGVNEIAVRDHYLKPFTRIKVGRRPQAVALSSDGSTAYVTNRFDDSVSIVNLAKRKTIKTVRLNQGLEDSLAMHGEKLFYDARISLDNWYSCNSCHTDGHTNSLLNDNLDDATIGTPKRVLSLLGVKDTGPWGWTASQTTLQAQVQHSLSVTMQAAPQKKDSKQRVKALTDFLNTLKPPPSISKARAAFKSGNESDGKVNTRDQIAAINRGKRIFQAAGCSDCHKSPTFTTAKSYDVGLSDEAGAKLFNPPSLRGVSQRDAYFHNAKAKTLKDVFTQFKHEGSGALSKKQIADLIAFVSQL
jgi:YVTN family beta-propeller protein